METWWWKEDVQESILMKRLAKKKCCEVREMKKVNRSIRREREVAKAYSECV